MNIFTKPAALAWTDLIKISAFTVAIFGFMGMCFASGSRYLRIDYPVSPDTNELQVAVTYTLWIPEGAKTIRGIIVHQHGAGVDTSREESTGAYDLHWQALAKKWDCALLAPKYHVLTEKNSIGSRIIRFKVDPQTGNQVMYETNGLNSGDSYGSEMWFDPRRGSARALLRVLKDFAAQSGHPEIETAPWALWGHSGGGIWADTLSTLYPERVVGMWLRSGTMAGYRTHPEYVQPENPAACYKIPIMVNPGVKEEAQFPHNPPGYEKGPWWGNLATFTEYRAHGAFIGFAPDPRTGHECGDSRYLAIPFLDACLAMRLPDKGSKRQVLKPVDTRNAWLAPLKGDKAVPAAEFKGDLKESVWLPNEAIAKAWMEYVKTGAVSDTTPPPAPYDVKTSATGDQGTEITWSAEADFESGIRNFVVLRDGQELAQVPEKPVGQYGRPLFQRNGFGDTPERPLPAMRYVDASAKAGERHSYTVITVNSVGLKSPPSAAAPVP